jgi:GNAT superfamily N-acetyltransferase
MNYILTDGGSADFAALCNLLDESLEAAVGTTVQRSKYAPMNTLEKIRDAVVAYDGALPVACGGFRYYDDGVAEVKRVFVRPDYRGRGISRQLMELLENHAREQGYRVLILETNGLLVPAMKLYESLGYKVIPNYGPYKDMPESVCMRKALI